jgi:hypothetical protein
MIISHKSHASPSLYCAWTVLSIVCFPAKQHDLWTNGILQLGFGLSFDDEETVVTETGHHSSNERCITT